MMSDLFLKMTQNLEQSKSKVRFVIRLLCISLIRHYELTVIEEQILTADAQLFSNVSLIGLYDVSCFLVNSNRWNVNMCCHNFGHY